MHDQLQAFIIDIGVTQVESLKFLQGSDVSEYSVIGFTFPKIDLVYSAE
jgi:hypothetical protein